MSYGTKIELDQTPDWTAESHSTHSVRYFNGRRYYVVDNHVFMSAKSGKRTLYWLHRVRYVAVEFGTFAPTHHMVSHRMRSVDMTGPSLRSRAMLALIPSDDQSVPF